MPELPEVETIVRELREAGLIGLIIDKALVFWGRSIAIPEFKLFCEQIIKQKILDIQRRGKFLVFSLTQDTLLVHLRMTGKFIMHVKEILPHSHERVRLYLNDGRILAYEDQRKFGKWYLVPSPNKMFEKIGLEPLSPNFTSAAFKNVLKNRNTRIKPFLLDQRFVAGLGNIYVDEALWQAKIHPLRSVKSLTAKEIKSLHEAIILVLEHGVENTGTSLGSARANYFSVSGRRGTNQQRLNVFRRDGLPCYRCQSTIQKMVLAQRGTHFCAKCQI
ncbi:MAG: DNA-formamidopyrimidine glycosylase [Candidatus Protochlamydia sp.]|nr:DNA-formamidopyrimidine glycosylase [Candidatus Protochlamydia sp.]